LSDPWPFVVRPAVAEDFDFVVALVRRLAAFNLPAWRRAEHIVEAETRELTKAFAEERHREDVFVAEEAGGTPLGFLYAERLADYFTGVRHGHVSMIAVAPVAEGRGVATALMRTAERWARNLGYPYLTLNVFHLNARARALYDRLGYQPDTVKYLKTL
jgi:ribosomal protein S18 acetylase RimI-like enzyme